MATNAERQRKYREAMQAKGLIQVTVWVPRKQAAAVDIMADMMCKNEDLEVGGLRSKSTGRITAVR